MTSTSTRIRILAPYKAILSTPGARGFVVAGILGRFPISMLGLGTVLLVSAVTGSYGLAGAVTATIALSEAAMAPTLGRLTDRRGQRPVLLGVVVAHVIGVTGLVTTAMTDAPSWLLFPTAAVAGGSLPQVGSMVRSRWASALSGTPRLSTAFSLESAIDEFVFVVGPVLATILAASVWPPGGIVVAAGLATVGALSLAAQRSSEPAPVPRAARGGSVLRSGGLRLVAGVIALIGVTFGSVDVSMVAFAEEHGHKAVSGFLLAGIAVGSLTAGLVYGTIDWSRPLRYRYLIALGGLAVGSAPLVLAPNLALMAPAGLLFGLAIAPTLVASVSLAETLAPAGARTEAFAWVSTSLLAGVSLGSWLAGRIVDAFSGHRSFLISLTGATLALVVALVGSRARPALLRAGSEVGDCATKGSAA